MGVMSVSDEDLAQARNISVEQVRLLRLSRGTTNETLETLPDAVLRQSLHRLAYPDRPALRTEFRFSAGPGRWRHRGATPERGGDGGNRALRRGGDRPARADGGSAHGTRRRGTSCSR